MTILTEFRLPDVGEGLTEAEIVLWHVAVGDEVAVNTLLCDIETAKSVVELPSPVAGTIRVIHAEPGATVDVGTVIVTIGDGSDAPAVPDPEPGSAAGPDRESELEPVEEKPLVLVGTGPTVAAPRRRRLGAAVNDPAVGSRRVATRGADRATPEATPSTTTDDRESRTPIKGIRKVTADAMSRSAFTAPHVTEWLTVDVTPTVELVARLRADRAWAGVRVNPMLLVARAFLLAIGRHPGINARWDEEAQEIVQHHYVNLGIAAATPRGLIVPNIKDAHTLDLAGLAAAMSDLVEVARAGKTSPEQMSHGTITITNIGALGVDAGTPILNPGEAAILAFGMIRLQPWVVDGAIVPRHVTQLAMSFDHRLVDGELGSHVLAEVGGLLADPGRAMTYG